MGLCVSLEPSPVQDEQPQLSACVQVSPQVTCTCKPTLPHSSNDRTHARGNLPISQHIRRGQKPVLPLPASPQGCPYQLCLDFFCLSCCHCHPVPPCLPVCFGRTRCEIWLLNKGSCWGFFRVWASIQCTFAQMLSFQPQPAISGELIGILSTCSRRKRAQGCSEACFDMQASSAGGCCFREVINRCAYPTVHKPQPSPSCHLEKINLQRF